MTILIVTLNLNSPHMYVAEMQKRTIPLTVFQLPGQPPSTWVCRNRTRGIEKGAKPGPVFLWEPVPLNPALSEHYYIYIYIFKKYTGYLIS